MTVFLRIQTTDVQSISWEQIQVKFSVRSANKATSSISRPTSVRNNQKLAIALLLYPIVEELFVGFATNHIQAKMHLAVSIIQVQWRESLQTVIWLLTMPDKELIVSNASLECPLSTVSVSAHRPIYQDAWVCQKAATAVKTVTLLMVGTTSQRIVKFAQRCNHQKNC